MLDKKFKIQATKVKDGSIITDADSVLFLGKDAALPAALDAYLAKCNELGAGPAQIEAVEKLIKRVKQYQLDNQAIVKVPDLDPITEKVALQD